MSSTRDDFSKETIRKAASRVGYRCSFPGCKSSTVGASFENNDKVSLTGVACHICAAAKCGPRFDPSMTPSERKGIENCIWMCQTHSKLIDSDTTTYSVEKLKKWKADAEKLAADALANSDYISEYYKSNGNNLEILKCLFDDMIVEGEFTKLKTMLDQYTTSLSEKYEEFILRYKIIYDVYCSCSTINARLTLYCKLPCKDGVDELAKLFFAFHMADNLNTISDFCKNEKIKEFAKLAIADELKDKLIGSTNNETSLIVPSDMEEAINEWYVNYIRINNIMCGLYNSSGKKNEFNIEKFFYCAILSTIKIISIFLYGSGNLNDIIDGKDFLFIKNNMKRINVLDPTYKTFIWANFLFAISEKSELFNEYYSKCPEDIKNDYQIKHTVYLYEISNCISEINIESILSFSEEFGEYSVLYFYLSQIKNEDAKHFLDEHRFLLKKDVRFLLLTVDLWNKEDENSSKKYELLKQYEIYFKNDFLYLCLLAQETKNELVKEECIQRLIQNYQSELNSYNIVPFIRVLTNNKRWDILVEISKMSLSNECLFLIAKSILYSNDDIYISESKTILLKLLGRNWRHPEICGYLGRIQHHFGCVESAKYYYQKEYDEYNSVYSLKNLMSLRLQTSDLCEDKYFEALKHCVDANSQNIIGAIYLKNGNNQEAQKFFLRSLLLNDEENVSLNGFWQATSKNKKEPINQIVENCVCTLNNEAHTLHIAIHSANILEGIFSPTKFADCEHFSSEDMKVCSLLFHEKNDEVMFCGEKYIITSVENSDEYFKKFFFSSLPKKKDVIVIKGANADDFIKNIIPILKSSSENTERIVTDYNQQALRSPLSLFSTLVGKSMLVSLEFLFFGNQSKIRNNMSSPKQNVEKFVLSYDVIVLLAYLDITVPKSLSNKLTCADQVKNRLLSDINTELRDIANNNRNGMLHYYNDRIAFVELNQDDKRKRYAFLIKLKKLVESIEAIIQTKDYEPANLELKKTFEGNNVFKDMHCENGSLGITREINNSVLVTDEQFLYSLAQMDGIQNTGIIGFVLTLFDDWKMLLDFSKQLHDHNYSNYLPFQLYKKIVDKIMISNDKEQGFLELKNWLLSDTEKEASLQHESIIIELARAIFDSKEQYLGLQDFIWEMMINIIEKRNPGYIKSCLDKLFCVTDDSKN